MIILLIFSDKLWSFRWFSKVNHNRLKWCHTIETQKWKGNVHVLSIFFQICGFLLWILRKKNRFELCFQRFFVGKQTWFLMIRNASFRWNDFVPLNSVMGKMMKPTGNPFCLLRGYEWNQPATPFCLLRWHQWKR